MEDKQEKMSPLEQMNKILSEKEAVIDAKLEKLQTYQKELKEFEEQLKEKVIEIQQAQKQISIEKAEIKKAWDDIRIYEKNLEQSMEEVLAEKVLIEQRSMSDLEKNLAVDDIFINESSEFDLNALKQSVGIDVPNFGTQPEIEKKEQELDVTLVEDKKEIEIPEIYHFIQQEVIKKFRSPKPYVIEETEVCLCMQIGSRELRVFANGTDENIQPVMHLIITHKNAKLDSKLQRKIAMLARVLPDWDFETKENQLTCIYYYEKEQDAKALVNKLKECIEKLEE